MRIFLTLLFIMCNMLLCIAQNRFVSVQDGNWNDASTWKTGAGLGGVEGIDFPSASDIVTIDNYVIIDATNNGTNFSFSGNLTINANDTLESQVGNNVAGFVLEGNGLMINNGSFFTLDATEEPNASAHIPYEFVCKDNSIFIGGINSFAFISDDWNIQDNAQIFIDNLNCYAVSDDVIFDGTNCNIYGEGNIRIGGDGANSNVEFNGGATAAQLDDDVTIWRNVASTDCSGTAVTTGTNTDLPPPYAFDDEFVTGINTAQNQAVLTRGVNDDFSPIEDDTVQITSAGSNLAANNGVTAEGGTVVVNNNGTVNDLTDDFITYSPPAGFTGIDTYNYIITNESGETEIAQVSVTINICGEGFIEDTTFTAVQSTSNNSGVDVSGGTVIGAPDGMFADWWDGADVLNMDFGQVFTAGTEYRITWRVRSGNTNAQPEIRESTTNGAFTTVTTAYIIADNTTQQTIVTSENDFRYLQIEKVNAVNATDFEIDAIQVIEKSCVEDNDNDGIPNTVDIDDDNDGIKDGDESYCAIPEAFWAFENTTDDASPNNHDERTTGSPPTFSTDAIQGTHSANFNGTTQKIRYSQDAGFMEVVGDTFSFSAWIKPTDLSGFRVLFEEGGGTNGWIVYLESGVPKVGSRVGGAGSQNTVTSSVTLSVDGLWHHIAGTFDLGVLTIYVDGVANSTPANGFTELPAHSSDGTVGGVTDDNPLDLNDASEGFYAGLMDGAKYSNFEVWDVNQIGYRCDRDLDGIVDQYDLDSDNDGISDITEAGGEDQSGDGKVDDIEGSSLFNDSNGNGLDDRYDFDIGGAQIELPDTDGDGLFDAIDLDSDNDGIPDVVEVGGTDVNGDGKADDYVDTDQDGFNDVVDGDVGNDDNAENSENTLVRTGDDANNDGIPDTSFEVDNDGDGIVNRLDLDADNDGIPDVVEQGGTDSNGDGRADNYLDSDNDGFNDNLDGDPTNNLTVGDDSPGTNSANALIATGIDSDGDGLPNSSPNGNLDQDQVYNFLDLDADDDGILDVLESGGTDINTDGIEDSFVDADNDGFNDNVDGDPDNSMSVGVDTLEAESSNATILTGSDVNSDGKPDTYPNSDFDGDLKLNHLDIDSDNDGLVDNTEGQPTTVGLGYIAPTNLDYDNDGIDNAYDSDDVNFGGVGSGFVLFDVDSGINPNTPDYLDLDSDNDGDLDDVEGHDTDNDGVPDGASPAGSGIPGGTADIDGDGLLDGFDNNTSSTDPTNNNLLGDSHPNIDWVATTEHDWREPLDNDEDGIPDYADIDDDNDGILDVDENPATCINPTVSFITVPEAFWSLDNNTDDISGNGHNQNNSGTVAPTRYSDSSVQGSHSAFFDGIDDKVRYSEVPAGFMESIYSEISFSAWILPYSLTGNRIIYEEGGTVHGSILWLADNILTYTTRVSSNQVNITHQTALTLDGEWHHVAVTYDNGVMTVYLDGVPSSSSPTNGTEIPAHSSDGGIGGDFGNNATSSTATANFYGLMDAVRYDNANAWDLSTIAAEAMQVCNADIDGDGILNQFDLDSDNDGIPDIVEAGGEDVNGDGVVDDITGRLLNNDTDNDGLDDRYDDDNGGTAITNNDTDNDGVINSFDLDSDNDGIPDVVEAGGTDENGDGRADNYLDTDEDGFNDVVDGDVGNDGTTENSANALTLTGPDGNSDGVPDSYPNDDKDGDRVLNFLDLDADNDGIPDVVETGGTDENGDGRIDNYVDTDNDGFNDIVDGDPTNALTVGDDSDGANSTNALLLTDEDADLDGEPDSNINDDFDGDNVYNFIDLDADDDGIMDVIEAGGTDVNRDGQEDGFTDGDGDGFNDNVDGDPTNALGVGTDTDGANAASASTKTAADGNGDGAPDSYPEDDFDGDGWLNYLDIDADNDGIVDNTEGQSTATYIAPADNDSDGDGIDDNYDDLNGFGGNGAVGYVLSDIDGTENPDYIDLDSDSDGDIDAVEGHDTDNDGIADGGSPSNTGLSGGVVDTDGDGLLDGYDNNTASKDPTNSGLEGTSHPNLDDPGTAEVDWREILDNDKDGITDIDDLDDDNDGIPDVEECNVAPLGVATQSSSLSNGACPSSSCTANLAIDGNTDGTFANGSVAHTTTETNPFWQVDLGSEFPISDIIVFNRTDACCIDRIDGYILEVLDASSSVVYTFTNTTGSIISETIAADVIGQTVRIRLTGASKSLSLAEVRVFSCGDADGDGITNQFDLDSDNDGIPDIVEAGGEDVDGDGRVDDLTGTTLTNDSDGDGLDDRYDSNNGGVDIPNEDFDNDGIVNTLDLDADNDGIMDVVEAGGTDSDRDGIEDSFVDTDEDGFNDNVDGDVGNDGVSENTANVTLITGNDGDGDGEPDTYPNANFDGDNNYDFLDIDADNDGIVDNTEGQSTSGYIAPANTDADGDGIDDAYDDDDAIFGGSGAVGYILSDIDAATDPNSPDYLDLNSDDDFFTDAIEGHDSDKDGVADSGSPSNSGLSGGTTDVDGDGLLDGYDNNTSSTDPTNSGLEGLDHPNNGNSATTERDWREAQDSDNDGIPDEVDVDKDNDGILDVDECLNNTSNSISRNTAGSSSYSQNGVTAVQLDITNVDNAFELVVNGGNLNANNILQFQPDQLSAGEVIIEFASDGADLTTPWVPNSQGLPRVRLFINKSGEVKLVGTRTTTSTVLEPLQTRDGSSFNSISFNVGANTFEVNNYDEAGGDNLDATLFIFSSCDTDGDGIEDYLDLDSDNDGIPDIIEAGGTDANNDGRVDVFVDSDNDGFADGLDPARGGTPLPDGDQDGDGFNNRVDLDADNDGLADIIEAGGTDADGDGYGDNSTDTDNDGWYNIFDSDNGGSALPIPDTDGDGFENYLDLDSDSDGIIDNIEWQTTANFDQPLGSDSDNNGWDDRYDVGVQQVVSNFDGADNPDYIDQNSDSNLDGQPDWMEGFDLDEDGDVLLDLIARADAYETAAGNPGKYPSGDDVIGGANGIPDFLDDADSDGIPNFLDTDNGTFYFDSDEDGLIDLYDDTNGGFGSATNDVSSLSNADGDTEPDFRDGDNDVTLPIQLVSFTATKVGVEVQLDWITETEINNDYFTIERSVDGENFEAILTEKGAGNSAGKLEYRRMDIDPKIGYNYYRLRQTDFDGSTETFNVEVVEFRTGEVERGEVNQISLYPNPTDGSSMTLELSKVTAGKCRVEILDDRGRRVKGINFTVQEAQTNYKLEVLNGDRLASGKYYLKLITESEIETLPFIVR